MKNIFALCIIWPYILFSQNQLPVPPLVSGDVIDIHVQHGIVEFFDGFETETFGFNGNLLGPTIELHKDQQVQINVYNDLNDTTTVHWHGLHVAAENDGGPHTSILPGEIWSPQFTVMNEAATYLYHPHAHMKTNEQVTKGAAALIIVRDDEEEALPLPRNYGVDDFPIVVQTKTFNDEKQIEWEMEYTADNYVLTNGVLDAFVELPAQIVRLRLLNGSNEKNINFGFDNNMTFYQIASDGGMLNNVVPLTRVMLSSGERAEILLDLGELETDTIHLMSYGSEIPLGVSGGPLPDMVGMNESPLDEIDFNVLQLIVGSALSEGIFEIPDMPLNDLVPFSENDVVETRSILMNGGLMGDPYTFNGQLFDIDVNNYEIPLGNLEKWTLSNMSVTAHPFHIHGVSFYVLSRDDAAPPMNETGLKDVVLVYPVEIVEVIALFEDFPDENIPYMYHCHILQHEEHGMMGQYVIIDTTSTTVQTSALHQLLIENPVETNSQIEISTSGGSTMKTVFVLDYQGRTVSEELLPAGANSIKAPGIPGMYLLKVSSEAGSFTTQLMVLN